jgi:hypothetical protein
MDRLWPLPACQNCGVDEEAENVGFHQESRSEEDLLRSGLVINISQSRYGS